MIGFLVLVMCSIKATKDLENYDKERHDEFKKYEMMKEHNRREHLKTLDEDGRRKEEEHYEELRKKHADHPKINHPVSQRHTYITCYSFNFHLVLFVCGRVARIN